MHDDHSLPLPARLVSFVAVSTGLGLVMRDLLLGGLVSLGLALVKELLAPLARHIGQRLSERAVGWVRRRRGARATAPQLPTPTPSPEPDGD